MLECKTTRKLGYCMVKKCVVCKLLKSGKSYSSALPSFSSSKTIYYLYQQMASFRYAFFFSQTRRGSMCPVSQALAFPSNFSVNTAIVFFLLLLRCTSEAFASPRLLHFCFCV